MRSQLVVSRTTLPIRRAGRFCWYFRLWSVLTKTSYPRRSAAFSKSPFRKFDHPFSYAVDTLCAVSDARNGSGVPWSNRTRLRGSQRTAGSVIEDNTHLFQRDAGEPFDKLHCGSPILEVFKKCSNRNARTSEYPCSADTFWVALTAAQENQ